MLLATIITALYSACSVCATDNIRIALQPGIERLSLSRGDVQKNTLKIRNTGAIGYEFRLYTEPFFVDENYENDFSADNSFTQIRRWIEFEEPKYHLEPGGVIEVSYIVRVPENAPGGGQYCVIFAEVEALDGAITVVNRVGTLIYAKVAGEKVEEGRVEFGKIEFWQTGPQITFYETAINDGNVDYDANTEITVKNVLTKTELNDSIVKPKTKTVLPETERGFEYKIGDITPGIYAIQRRAMVFGQEYLDERIVLVLPLWYIVFGVLLIVSVSLLIGTRIHRRRCRKKALSTSLRR